MASITTQQLFESALAKYGVPPSDPAILKAKSDILKLLKGQLHFQSDNSVTCVVTDIMEDVDDLIMLLYGVMNTTGTIIVIVSGGYFTSDERLAYLSSTLECFKGASFDTPFLHDNKTIHFIRDGELIHSKVKRFINCGPCSSLTLNSIQFEPNSVIVTVGANDDGTLSVGINQHQTDTPGKLIILPNVWNDFIAKAKQNNVSVKNMSIQLTRYVLFPNPFKHQLVELLKPDIYNAMLQTAGMFIVSRPPPIALRVNEGNSIIDLQMFSSFDPSDEKYKMGLSKVEEYKQKALMNTNTEQKHYEAAAIPIMITYSLGGIYKENTFGFSPTDKHAKETLGCLTPESAEIVLQNIKQFDYLTPAYDPLAYIEAFTLTNSIH